MQLARARRSLLIITFSITRKQMGSLPVGPFGGSGGRPWNYNPNGPITQIVIAHSSCIESITFKHQTQNGCVESSDKFGGNGGKIVTINIDNPSEYLTSIDGTLGPDRRVTVVRSIRLVTNLRKYGPFGTTEGTLFATDIPEGGVILGFHGRSGILLDAIGAYLKPNPLESLPIGPFGGSGGCAWNYKPTGPITEIEIAHSSCIESITFKHQTSDGFVGSSDKFGGTGGNLEIISIDNPSEYLTSIDGTFDQDRCVTVIRSIRVVTNLRKYGPFGSTEGTLFATDIAKGGVIVGFHGRSGLLLDAIGVHLKPKHLEPGCAPVGLGPWGGLGGNQWDYQPKGAIRKIVINHGQCIDSIMFKHDNEIGSIEDSEKFGGNGGSQTEITIDGPCEYLTQISGSYDTIVTSLRFVTNLQTYGPYGSPRSGTPFALPIKEGATIVGFHGRSGNLLDAIGFYLKPK